MQPNLAIDESRHVLLIRFEGPVDDEMLRNGYQAARNWIAQNGPAAQISDFTNATPSNITAETVRQLALAPPLAPDEFPRVVVAPTQVVFGLARMFEAIGSTTRDRIHIVRSLDQAYRLLRINTPDFKPITETSS